MTNDERATAHRLGHGLPRLLGEDPDKLNDLLGLRRQERLRIATLVPKEVRARIDAQLKGRPEPVKPGERDRVFVQVHYGHPEVRRAAWHVALEQGPGGKPSPEATVLADFVVAEREVSGDASEPSADDRTEAERIADRAWADTRERLARWDALDEPEREQCVLRTFAVATIRDDPAILTEAIDLASDLADQFESLLPREEEKADSGCDPLEPASARWTALTGSLKKLASRAAGPPPNPDLLDEIASAVESLRELEPSLGDELSSEAFGKFLAEVCEKLDAIQSDKTFRLDDERRTALEEKWERCRGSLTGDELEKERRRFETAVSEAAELVRMARKDLSEATCRIEAHRAEEPDDPFAQDTWAEVLADLQQKERKCRKRHQKALTSLLNALTPSSEGLDKPSEPEPPGPTPPKPAPLKPPPPKPAPPKPPPPKPPPPKPAPSEPPPPKPAPPKPPPPKPAPRDPLAVKAQEAITAALLEKPPRLAYAFQVARLIETVFPGSTVAHGQLLGAAALSDRLREPEGAIAMRFAEVLADFPAPNPGWSDDEVAFQTTTRFAVCLQPALFAPNTGALSVLTSLPRSRVFAQLHGLAQRIAGHAAKVQHAGVELSLLRAMRTSASRDAALERCRDDIREWRRNALKRKMLYQPATAVLLRWVQDSGVIGRLMKKIETESVRDSEVRQAIARWRDPSYLQRLVQSTDRDIRGSLRRGAGIHSRANQRLVQEAGRAADLAQRYLECLDSPPDASDFRVRVLSELRRDLDRLAPDALKELRSADFAWSAAGARIAERAIDRLRATLNPDDVTEEVGIEPIPDDLLASGFFTSRIVLDSQGEAVGEPREVLTALIEEASLPLGEVVRCHLDSGDLHLARRILDWFAREGGEGVHDVCRDLGSARQHQQEKLEAEIGLQRDRIESGLMLGSVSADARERLVPVLFESERQLGDPAFFRFREIRDRVNAASRELDRMEEEHLRSVQTDFKRLSLTADSPQAGAISRAIEQRDIVTANELIQQARTDPHVELPGPLDRDILSEFSPEKAKAITDDIENAGGTREVLARIRRGRLFGDLPGARRDSAVRMVEAWIGLKGQRRLEAASERLIRDLFSEIGFVVRGVEAKPEIPNACELGTVPLENRDQSPVPVYGSGARGRYRVICCWNRPAVEDLMQYTHQRGGGDPPIVLYFGRLSERQRAELAVVCRERQETLVVFDETVLVFLCEERGSRLSSFFHCTLPFTYLMPYHTQGGKAPPEMFFGRAQETAAVRSPRGPCFIYGGRQLGKTAILKAVEQREHCAAEGRFAFFVDLLAHDLGTERPPTDIWPLLWEELRTANAIPSGVPEPSTKSRVRIESFLNALAQHFAPDSGRTLLLLLDEADRFLEEDARERQSAVAATRYRESIRLKRLMDDTDRCIKVVFAGLHDVLRTAEHGNHPLGQFGKPIQVGPLLRNGGMRAARDLLTRPLLAAGYRLPADLVTRILGQTNYYPGLIQAYGAELIRTMLTRWTGSPPRTVENEVVEAAYRTEGLREFIRSRFQLTLNLDKRYEVIAYSVAFLCLTDESALATGIPRFQIYNDAAGWWPTGFIESSGDRFTSLLDEMVGLGVLRKTGEEEEQRYSLRNPNVLLLIGTLEQIAEKLEEEREPPQEFKPRILRARRRPDEPNDPLRSPLTFHQHDQLFVEKDGVLLLSGVPAAGLNDLLDTFETQPDRPLVRLEGVPDLEFFGTALRGSVKRQEEGLRVHAVPSEAAWTADWIRDAQKYLNSLRKSNRQVRVLFLAGGDRLLALLRDRSILKLPSLERIALEPWRDGFLRQWMQEVAIGDSADLRRQILDLTGGWPALLTRLHELTTYHENAELGLSKLNTELSDGDQQQEWRDQLCLDDPVTRAVLRPLVDYGDLRREEIVEEAVQDDLRDEEVMLRLRWADHLNLVQQGPKWKINPLVGKLVAEGSQR